MFISKYYTRTRNNLRYFVIKGRNEKIKYFLEKLTSLQTAINK